MLFLHDWDEWKKNKLKCDQLAILLLVNSAMNAFIGIFRTYSDPLIGMYKLHSKHTQLNTHGSDFINIQLTTYEPMPAKYFNNLLSPNYWNSFGSEG